MCVCVCFLGPFFLLRFSFYIYKHPPVLFLPTSTSSSPDFIYSRSVHHKHCVCVCVCCSPFQAIFTSRPTGLLTYSRSVSICCFFSLLAWSKPSRQFAWRTHNTHKTPSTRSCQYTARWHLPLRRLVAGLSGPRRPANIDGISATLWRQFTVENKHIKLASYRDKSY